MTEYSPIVGIGATMVSAVVPQSGVKQWWWGGPAGIGPTWAFSLLREKDKKGSPEIFLSGAVVWWCLVGMEME